MSNVNFKTYMQHGFFIPICTLIGGTAVLVAAKGLQKSWAGACWAYSQGWSAPRQIAAQGMEFAKAIPSKGKEAWQGMDTVLKSKEMALAFLSGTASSLSYKYSPLAVKVQFPFKKESYTEMCSLYDWQARSLGLDPRPSNKYDLIIHGHYAIQNRILMISLAVFATTFVGLQAFRQRYQMSQVSVLGHTTTSTLFSLAAIAFVESYQCAGFKLKIKECKGDIFEYFDAFVRDYTWYQQGFEKARRFQSCTADVSWKSAAWIGIAAGIAVLAQLPIAKTMQEIHRGVPSTKGIYPGALVMTPMMIGANLLCTQKEKQEIAPILLLVPTVLVAGTVLTSELSAIMLKDRVCYLPSAAIVVGGFYSAAPIISALRRSYDD